ncbi:acyl transferase/acyl hydrolase/lysophospholipase [Xylaria grammica]|nr:acyl transferase/acyl hydrolase/lysophospholipase [Xylaria grammica]
MRNFTLRQRIDIACSRNTMDKLSKTHIKNSRHPLRILSLDGGGIRGLSSLIILEEIMRKVAETENRLDVVRPCDYFDLIGGTNTGGIIAIMLGRLGMTVNACIQAYKKVAAQAFTPKIGRFLPASPRGSFSAKALESAIKQVIRENCVEEGCRQGGSTGESCPHEGMTFYGDSPTKTAVVAITKENVNAEPTLLKSYDNSPNYRSCSIWQVARATSAATTFFKSIRIGRDEVEFIDAGFGYNNPCELIIREAERIFLAGGELKILSIGTGIGDVVTIKDTRLSIINALKRMATSSSKVDASLNDRYRDSGQYFRFEVNEGLGNVALSDWELTSQISAHTHNYITNQQQRIDLYAKGFRPAPYSLAPPKSESEGKATHERAQGTVSADMPKQAKFNQAGSKFYSMVSGREVKQGNRLEVTHAQLYYRLVQGGSEFRGKVDVQGRLEQGNCIAL